MKDRIFETFVGFVVLCCSVWFFIFAYNRSNWHDTSGYTLVARFDNVDGISKGSIVKVSGVKVGVVTDICIDEQSYLAKISMNIDNSVKLPIDSEAVVSSEGILGGKYISLTVGNDETLLNDKDEIVQTRGGQNLESLIGKFLLSPKQQEQ